ncbi:MAG: DUF4432 family protein [Candidatus Nanopelagicaceae bacterium]|nr:DUF4432 family protein [Candidatus Nanopelagicaceae bacterium]
MTPQGPRDPFTRRATGHYGRLALWEGHEILEMTSPDIHLKVSLTRGAEILELRSKKLDLDLLWHGHEDIVRLRPAVQSIETPIGNFLDHFSGGWQEVLPAAQYPVSYRGTHIGAHGEVALLSWDYRILQDAPETISVEFSVNLRRFPMRLVRVMTLTGGQLRFDESVENLSGESLEFQWGQHLVLGGPFVDPGMEIVVNSGERVEIPNYPGPTYRFKPETESTWPMVLSNDGEEVDVSIFGADDGTDGHLILGPMKDALVLFRNHSLSADIKVGWNAKTFPYCWVWMVLGGIKDWPLWGKERLITIEPFSSPVISLTDAIANGTALKLGAYESMQTWVSFTVQTSPSL